MVRLRQLRLGRQGSAKKLGEFLTRLGEQRGQVVHGVGEERRAAGEAATRSARENGKAAAIGQLQNSRDLTGIGRMDNRIGKKFHLGSIVAVTDQILLFSKDIFSAHN